MTGLHELRDRRGVNRIHDVSTSPLRACPSIQPAHKASSTACWAANVSDVRPAGVVSRGVAAVIDLIVVAIVLGAIYLGLLLSRLMFHPTAFRVPTTSAIFSTAVLFVVAVGYLTACWAVSGCTVGSVTMGLRVTGRRGGALLMARHEETRCDVA